jgi:hypothetical protein
MHATPHCSWSCYYLTIDMTSHCIGQWSAARNTGETLSVNAPNFHQDLPYLRFGIPSVVVCHTAKRENEIITVTGPAVRKVSRMSYYRIGPRRLLPPPVLRSFSAFQLGHYGTGRNATNVTWWFSCRMYSISEMMFKFLKCLLLIVTDISV